MSTMSNQSTSHAPTHALFDKNQLYCVHTAMYISHRGHLCRHCRNRDWKLAFRLTMSRWHELVYGDTILLRCVDCRSPLVRRRLIATCYECTNNYPNYLVELEGRCRARNITFDEVGSVTYDVDQRSISMLDTKEFIYTFFPRPSTSSTR